MALRALSDDLDAAWGGEELPTWAEPYPRSDEGERRDPFASATSAGPDDTHQADAEEPRRRRTSGPRRRLSLTSDLVRDAIEERYREEGQWEALIELYLSRVEFSASEIEKNELLKRVADVFFEELCDQDQAFDALVEALARVPDDEETAEALERIARRSKKKGWGLLISAVSAKLDAEKDDARALRFAELLARWYRNELKDPASAEPFVARVRKINPSHPLVHRRMASMYREAGVWDAQRDALERALACVTSDSDKRSIHLALADIHEKQAKNPAKARVHYEAALGVDASSMDALRGLERIARVSEQHAELATVLDRQIDATESDAERIGALMRLADLHERSFVRPESAASKFEVVLAFDPNHEGALDGLERCYRAMRAWDKLVATLERRSALSGNPLEKCDCLMKVALVEEGKRGDVSAALTALERVYGIDDGHVQALAELSRLCEKKRDFTGAAAYRARLADLAEDARVKAQIHTQVAEMLSPVDRDPECARLHYEKAVAFDPTNIVAWEGLQRIATRSGDEMYTVFCLERRAHQTESPRLKGQLLVELGRLRESLGDTRGALATYEYAIHSDPSNEAAARVVIDEYVRVEKWAEASPVCELLLNAATRDGTAARIFDLLRLSARIATALGNEERAMLAALAAFDMRPSDRLARAEVIDACHRMRGDVASRERIDNLISSIAETPAELFPTSIVKIAEIKRSWGDDEGAILLLGQALTLDAEHKRALATLAEIYGARGEWSRACQCRLRIARSTASHDERYAILLETADIWHKKANNAPRAVQVLEGVLETRPGDVTVLHRLGTLYGELSAWDRLTRTLRALADVESDPARRARSLFALAQVVRDKLADAPRAVQIYEEVLDLDGTRLDAFEHVVRIHTELRDWGALRLAYSKMLARVPAAGEIDLKHALYHQLGLVYRDRLGDAAHALDSFRFASRLKPHDEQDRKIVLELLVVMDQLDVAVATARQSARRAPFNAAVYRDLYDLFLRERHVDKAWCAAGVLAHLGGDVASEEQRTFLNEYPPYALANVPGTLASGAWSSHVLHPGLDPRLTAIFRIVAPAILRMRFKAIPYAQRARWLGRPVRANESPAAARLTLLVHNAAEILGIPTPELFDRPTMPVPLAVAPSPSPALFVSLEAAEAIPQDLLPFLVARRVAELRPELAAHALFPTVGELKSLLKGAVRAALSGPRGDGAKPHERALAQALEPKELEALRNAVSTVIGNAAKVDMRRWVQLADVTLSRVGLLLVGDVDVAWRALAREARSPGDLSANEAREELVAFAVSEEHADLRVAIGVSLETMTA
jgi:tetratricopeptide (TPR) repeat protein